MARFLKQFQTLKSLTTSTPKFHQSPSFLGFTSIRSQSNQSSNNKSDVSDPDTAESPPPPPPPLPPTTADPDQTAFRKIDDAIHRILVRRAEPDWLPFVPGASYYAPPRSKTDGIGEMVGKFTHKLSEDEALSLVTERGWPSSAYYVPDAPSQAPSCQIEIDVSSESDESEDDEA